MTDDYGCKVCGKHFEEEEDLKNHGEYDHPEVNEVYPEIFDKKEEKPAEEIDQQEDKPVQSHDDWQKELEGLQDEFATEQEKCAICNGEHPTAEHPVIEEGGSGSGPQEGSKPSLLPEQVARAGDPHYNPFKATPQSDRLQTDPALSRTTEGGYADDQNKRDMDHYLSLDEDGKKEWRKKVDAFTTEEGGADDPLKKVADLAENYKYMSRDNRISLFESLKFTQGDSAILSGLEWNELTRPIKVEASEAYIKEQEEPEVEAEETEEDEENKAYEALYNVEKYHTSPDYKKKAIACNRCNEAFYNTNDRNIHYNDVHATEQEYNLPEQCPFCKEIIQEPETLDWHMQEEHGAHVPSTYTQTGVSAGMADTDFDSLESYAKENDQQLISQTFYSPYEMRAQYGMDTEDTSAWSHSRCKICGNDSFVEDYDRQAMIEHAKNHGMTESKKKANEARSASDLREEIKKQENFINLASFENPMNMGDAQNKLDGLRSELESLGGEDLGATEDEEGWGDNWGSPEETEKDLYDLGHPEKAEEEDVELVPDKGKFLNMMTDMQAPPEKEAEEEEDDDDEYECEDCGKTFNDPAHLQEHQYSNWHGEYKDDYEGQSEPRNVMGGY